MSRQLRNCTSATSYFVLKIIFVWKWTTTQLAIAFDFVFSFVFRNSIFSVSLQMWLHCIALDCSNKIIFDATKWRRHTQIGGTVKHENCYTVYGNTYRVGNVFFSFYCNVHNQLFSFIRSLILLRSMLPYWCVCVCEIGVRACVVFVFVRSLSHLD